MKDCPYLDCDFTGTEEQVDDHRAYAHRSELPPEEKRVVTVFGVDTGLKCGDAES